MSNFKTSGHGTIKKLRTGAVVSVLALSSVYGVSTTVSADEVGATTNNSIIKTVEKPDGTATKTESAKTDAPVAKVTEHQVAEAKTQADTANQAVQAQQGVVNKAETAVSDADKVVNGTTNQIKEVETVTPAKVDEAKQAAQTKSDELAKAEDSVKSAEQSQADTAKKVADQTTVVNQAEANANKTASAVTDAQKKVDDLSKSTTDTTKLQKDVDDLTKKVSDDQKSLETAKQSLDTAKSAEANKAKAIEDAKKAVNDATKTEASAKQTLDTAKSAEAASTKKVEDAKKALDVAKAGTTKQVQVGTKTVTTGGKATLKDGVAKSEFFDSNGVVTSDAYLKAIKALAEGRGSYADVRKAIADGVENVPGSSLADIAAPNRSVFKSWKSNYNPQFSNTDSTTKVSVHDLTDEQLTDLALFYTALVNDLRSKVGTEPLKVTKESIAATKQALKDLFNKTFPAYNNMSEAELKANGFWGPESIKKVTESNQTQEHLNSVQGSGKLLNGVVANQVQYQGHNGAYQTMADLKANLLAFVGNMLYGSTGTGSNVSTAGTSRDNFSDALALLGLRGNYNSAGVGVDFYTTFNGLGYSAPATYALMLNTNGEAIDNPYQTLAGGKTEVVPIYETKTIVDEKAVADAQTKYDTAVKADQDAKAKLAEAQTKYDTAMKALADAQKQLSDLQSGSVDIPALEKAVVDAQAQLDADKASLQSAKETLAVAKASAVDKANALSKAQAELVKAKAENTKAQQALTQAKEELEVLTKANGVAKQAVESATANRDKVKVLADEANKKSQDLETALTNKPAVLKELNSKLAEAQTKAAAARAELETAKEALSKLQVTAKEKVAKYNELAKLKAEQDKAEADAKRLQDLKNKANEIRKNGGQPKEVLDAKGNVVDVVDAAVKEVPTNSKVVPVTYSRVERGKQLPNTGSKGSMLGLLGLSLLVGLGLGYKGKHRRG
ncbi:TPA: SEC10/PgrA surface exclusion domain-containing protein [Streptococcus agalactiae]|uniref:SEC10/PgrA surface exclusion domain-containing protein n=1 Tax=Streptococcus anginosus TaxID=1328 RepID=UPI0003907D3B|nr:SEC10/PgrA surface exclusion domain-containing protein [Streptococcus anginosus]HEO0063996.1 SEC10/PgrA surface exclusion domain-containing protein [Streptococcus agalactiae]AGU84443.1 LPXTG cell wall surface protein [Streptococcus anginosus C238]MDP1384948.1 SEC10/PgrA surface exclusion domain-containing protein [Streptococcus anginosus]HEO2586284.1 SEC10/PgrA surface exclusion domain-containing protein [Streptococcus agalactiae]HEO8745418.1 SEC10/PgrA surface exclusion domain-containing p